MRLVFQLRPSGLSQRIRKNMKTVMVSGHFDPMHEKHLAYIESALNYGDFLLCIVSTDEQIKQKKGKVNIPEEGRLRLVRLVLQGLTCSSHAALNVHDKGTTLVAEALRYWHPEVFCRGNDKILTDTPLQEAIVCKELGIKIIHAEFKGQRHGSEFV